MKRVLIQLFLFMLVGLLQGQRLRFKHLTSEDGLSTVLVQEIIQDDKGFIWIATQDGLNKYDGFKFKVFRKDPTNENSLPSSDILCLNQVSPSLILVGTRNGLGFFNPVNETFLRNPQKESRLNQAINAICVYNDSLILAGTDENLLLINIRTRRLVQSYFDSITAVKCIKQLSNGIYLGTGGKGLFKFVNNSVQKVNLDIITNGLPLNIIDSYVTSIAQSQDHIFLGTYGNSILQMDKNFKFKKQISFASTHNNAAFISALCVFGNKLYASTYHGLAVYNLKNEDLNFYEKKEGQDEFNATECNAVFIDKDGNCWVGTNLNGINVAFTRSLRFPLSSFGFETNHKNIFSFNETGSGKLIIGGVKTFKEIDPSNGMVTDLSGFLGSGTALCIAKQTDDVYWIGTWGNGLFRYERSKNKARQFLAQEGGTILCLRIFNSHLFAGTVGDGLFKINLETLETMRFTEKEGLPGSSISDIYLASDNQLWLATLENGMALMEGFDKDGKFKIKKNYLNKGQPGEIASNEVRLINQDKSGGIWAATASGLSRQQKDGSFRNYYERDGLPSASLYSLVKDQLGNFWMSTNSGIVKFNPLTDGGQINFKTFGVKDGLVNTEFNMGAYYLSTNGTLCFGGTGGFNVFNPGSITNNLNPPKAYVTGYKRGGKDVATDSLIQYKTHLNLNWRENYFQFELTALDFADPAACRFSYKLDGYDAEWSELTNVRYVSYTELPGGDYTFMIKAANNDGVWNEQPYKIKITVVPPFWKTKTFYVLVILLVIGGAIAYTQYRTRVIKKENKILEAKVAERTKELHEKNLDIMSSIQYAQRIQEAILPAKDNIFAKLKKVFILYRPKDIVSGDFYWFTEKNGVKIFAVVDCTGHGVPGAFMSMIGHNLLNQIVLENAVTDPGDILNHLHRGVQAALRQGHNEISTNDGMDVSLITINESAKCVKWAGANRPLVLINEKGEFVRLEGDKFPVGGAQAYVDREFVTKNVEIAGSAMAYLFSDGYADQFGGEKGKKFMVKRLHEILSSIHQKSEQEQRDELENHFLNWKQNHEQVDDVLLVGIRINGAGNH